MKLNFLYFLLLLSVAVLNTSCGGDDDIDCNDEREITEAINGLSDELIEASLQFSQDPSQSNCENIRDVYSRWIDNLESVENCADQVGQGDEFRQAINEAREGLNNFTC